MANSCKLSLTIAATVIVLIAAALPTEGDTHVTFIEGPKCTGNKMVSYSDVNTCHNITYTGGYLFYHSNDGILNFYDVPDCASFPNLVLPNTLDCKEITHKSFKIFKFAHASGIRQVTAGN